MGVAFFDPKKEPPGARDFPVQLKIPDASSTGDTVPIISEL